jgi:three-Cys-motif partner protein
MSPHQFGGNWTEQKLRVLDEYLSAYCRIFEANERARFFETTYADAFAGSGVIRRKVKQKEPSVTFEELAEEATIGFLRGSAARAVKHPFGKYLFIEKSETRVAELRNLQTSSGIGERISIRKGDANKLLVEWIDSTDWGKSRAVVFLDPYGMQVEWDTIKKLGETKAVDLWFLFPLGQAVMRLLRKEGEPLPEWQEALDRIFGTTEWKNRFYITERHRDLFDQEIVQTRRNVDWQQVQNFMIDRLKSVFHSVCEPGILWNSRNSPLYLFCFAAANPQGAPTAMKIAKHLLKTLNDG